MRRLAVVVAVALTASLAATSAHPAIARSIEENTEALQELAAEAKAASADDAASREAQAAQMARLEAAIAQGKDASNRLRDDIAALEQERDDLQRVQTILASGLIGALITALVAVLGALSNFRRWRAEKDLKRLEVLEKAHQLRSEGVALPADIATQLGEAGRT